MTTKTTETGSPRDSGANYDEMRDRISDIRNVDLYPSDMSGERARELIIGIISGIECYVQVLSESDDDIGNRIITAFDEANGTYILECFIKDRQNLKSILRMIGGAGTDNHKSMRSGDFRDDLMSESDFTALVKRVKKGSEQYEYDPDKEIM